MPNFRFKLQRTEVRDLEVTVKAETFERAAQLAAAVYDFNVPRNVTITRGPQMDDSPSVRYDVSSGREL